MYFPKHLENSIRFADPELEAVWRNYQKNNKKYTDLKYRSVLWHRMQRIAGAETIADLRRIISLNQGDIEDVKDDTTYICTVPVEPNQFPGKYLFFWWDGQKCYNMHVVER